MKLYNFGWGPYPRRVTIYLAEKGITALDTVSVEFPHRPELWPPGFLRKLNAAHSLPVLDTGRGVMIGQSIAILEYLEELHPRPDLLGPTPEDRAVTREMIAIFDEAAAFFGIWARHGSRVNADRHPPSLEAARVGAERFIGKLRVAEHQLVGPFLTGAAVSIADCIAMALLEFTDQFYGVTIPEDCPKLARWYASFSQRPSATPPEYPPQMRGVARGLQEQTESLT